MPDQPHVIVIGAGFTGCAVAHDLALRGIRATVLDRGEIASGTSGRTHGLLHSGGRYCVNDKESAVECIEENKILRKIAKQCIEFNGGYFVALNESDLEYAPLFEAGAQECGIEIEKIPVDKALKVEPNLNPNVLAVYTVPDGTFDPLRLALAFAATAKKNGAEFRPYHEVTGLIMNGQGNVTGAEVWDRVTNHKYKLHGDMVVNATGAWAGAITKMVNAKASVVPTPGIMVAYDQRLINRVVNRLNAPGDGDILIPQRRMVCIGTTSFEVSDADYIPIEEDQVEFMYRCAVELVPAVKSTNQRGWWMSARPLVGSGESGRSLARTFKCFDHKATDNIDGLVTITGGKATTCRAMAETTVDVVCEKLGIRAECVTRETPLISYRNYYLS
ncbi:MAG: FAD-dependent oxidoreductase [Chloroflexi bacterium]|nr:FAD-dependent oxidoreductase [Chloroflexota bacterium]